MSKEHRVVSPPSAELLARIRSVVPPEWHNRGGLGNFGIEMDYANATGAGIMIIHLQWRFLEGHSPAPDEATLRAIKTHYAQTPTYTEYLLSQLERLNQDRIHAGKPVINSEKVVAGLFGIIPQAQRLDRIAFALRKVASGDFHEKEVLEKLLRLIAESLECTHSPEHKRDMLKRYGLRDEKT